MTRLIFVLSLVLFISSGMILKAQEKTKRMSVFRDSLDHAIDISDWLVNKKGVLIVPTLITEPAVDFGIAGAAIFFHSSYSEKKGPPSMTGAMGGATLNGTWMAGAFHAGYWKQDNIRYLGAAAKIYANLDFYGSGDAALTNGEPAKLNLDAWFLLQQIKFRIGGSDFFIGGSYMLLMTDNTFELPIDIPEFTGTEFSSTLSEVSLKIELDSRNNIFTPTKGVFVGLNGTYSDTWLGSDDLYGRIGITILGYLPAGRKLNLGIRHEVNYTLGNIPFYARPIVNLRGAPLMKYQDAHTIVLEAELSYNVFKRWFISGFTGMGNAFSSFEDFKSGKSVSTYGTGFRYLIARKMGTNMGMDFAWSMDDFAFYIVFGTAWMR
jgi:hypothetical protein